METSTGANSRSQTNPLKEDAVLNSLLKDLKNVATPDAFDEWRDSFLSRFVEFLDEDGAENAENAYWEFADTMSSLINVINKLDDLIERGMISTEKCTVKALQCLQEFSREITVVGDKVDKLIPSTMSLERTAGYTKFHIGAILVQDGFREYARMSLSADALERMESSLEGVADRQILLNMKSYANKLQTFCDVMADLGLFDAMLKCRDFVHADLDEERIYVKVEGCAFEDSAISPSAAKGKTAAGKPVAMETAQKGNEEDEPEATSVPSDTDPISVEVSQDILEDEEPSCKHIERDAKVEPVQPSAVQEGGDDGDDETPDSQDILVEEEPSLQHIESDAKVEPVVPSAIQEGGDDGDDEMPDSPGAPVAKSVGRVRWNANEYYQGVKNWNIAKKHDDGVGKLKRDPTHLVEDRPSSAPRQSRDVVAGKKEQSQKNILKKIYKGTKRRLANTIKTKPRSLHKRINQKQKTLATKKTVTEPDSLQPLEDANNASESGSWEADESQSERSGSDSKGNESAVSLVEESDSQATESESEDAVARAPAQLKETGNETDEGEPLQKALANQESQPISSKPARTGTDELLDDVPHDSDSETVESNEEGASAHFKKTGEEPLEEEPLEDKTLQSALDNQDSQRASSMPVDEDELQDDASDVSESETVESDGDDTVSESTMNSLQDDVSESETVVSDEGEMVIEDPKEKPAANTSSNSRAQKHDALNSKSTQFENPQLESTDKQSQASDKKKERSKSKDKQSQASDKKKERSDKPSSTKRAQTQRSQPEDTTKTPTVAKNTKLSQSTRDAGLKKSKPAPTSETEGKGTAAAANEAEPYIQSKPEPDGVAFPDKRPTDPSAQGSVNAKNEPESADYNRESPHSASKAKQLDTDLEKLKCDPTLPGEDAQTSEPTQSHVVLTGKNEPSQKHILNFFKKKPKPEQELKPSTTPTSVQKDPPVGSSEPAKREGEPDMKEPDFDESDDSKKDTRDSVLDDTGSSLDGSAQGQPVKRKPKWSIKDFYKGTKDRLAKKIKTKPRSGPKKMDPKDSLRSSEEANHASASSLIEADESQSALSVCDSTGNESPVSLVEESKSLATEPESKKGMARASAQLKVTGEESSEDEPLLNSLAESQPISSKPAHQYEVLDEVPDVSDSETVESDDEGNVARVSAQPKDTAEGALEDETLQNASTNHDSQLASSKPAREDDVQDNVSDVSESETVESDEDDAIRESTLNPCQQAKKGDDPDAVSESETIVSDEVEMVIEDRMEKPAVNMENSSTVQQRDALNSNCTQSETPLSESKGKQSQVNEIKKAMNESTSSDSAKRDQMPRTQPEATTKAPTEGSPAKETKRSQSKKDASLKRLKKVPKAERKGKDVVAAAADKAEPKMERKPEPDGAASPDKQPTGPSAQGSGDKVQPQQNPAKKKKEKAAGKQGSLNQSNSRAEKAANNEQTNTEKPSQKKEKKHSDKRTVNKPAASSTETEVLQKGLDKIIAEDLVKMEPKIAEDEPDIAAKEPETVKEEGAATGDSPMTEQYARERLIILVEQGCNHKGPGYYCGSCRGLFDDAMMYKWSLPSVMAAFVMDHTLKDERFLTDDDGRSSMDDATQLDRWREYEWGEMRAICHNTYKAINFEQSRKSDSPEPGRRQKKIYKERKRNFADKDWFDKFSLDDFKRLPNFPPALNYLHDSGFQFLPTSGSDESLRQELLRSKDGSKC